MEEHFFALFMDDGNGLISGQLNVIKHFPSFLNVEDSESMDAEVSMEEIEHALKSFKKDRSPGPYGWPVEFFLFFLTW